MDTFEKIRALLAEQLDIDPAKITMESDIMSDFEADSLDIVDMVMTLEDEFGIEVPDDAIENLRTVGDVVEVCGQPQGLSDQFKQKSPASAAAAHGRVRRRGFIIWVRAERLEHRRLAHGLGRI